MLTLTSLDTRTRDVCLANKAALSPALGNKHEMACHYILDLYWFFVGTFHMTTTYGIFPTRRPSWVRQREGMPAEDLSLV
jgi:hypothetical protein